MSLINDLMGNLGKYHLWLCTIIFFNKFGTAFHQLAFIFLAPPVMYYCPGNNETCCDNPVYNTSIFSRTIVMEWNLICERSWLKDLTQTLFQFGVLAGSLLWGMASDRYGRRKILIICVIMEVLTGLMASFLPDYWSFTMVRTLLGLSVGGIMVVGFVIVMEYVGEEYRYIVSALFHVPFTTGHILLALFGYLIRDYVYFQLGISIVNVVLLAYICLLPESPRWLLAANRTQEAIDLIEHVAKINNIQIENIQGKIDLYQMEHRHSNKSYVWDLFRTPNLRKNIIIMSIVWFVCSYYFYGVSFYISRLSGDIYVNVAASGAVCVCSCLISIPLMKFMQRKTVVVISNISCGICMLLIIITHEGIASLVVGCIGLLFSFIIFVVAYLYSSEMFPTVVRNAALGLVSMMARFGSMISPFIASLSSSGYWCAPLAFGMCPLLAAVLCIWLPETKGCDLVMTLEEGEAVGKKTTTTTRETATAATSGVT